MLELLVVISIMALATAGISLALRDNGQTQLEREAARLAALLESGRAQSRASGVPVRWRGGPQGFNFEGCRPMPCRTGGWRVAPWCGAMPFCCSGPSR